MTLSAANLLLLPSCPPTHSALWCLVPTKGFPCLDLTTYKTSPDQTSPDQTTPKRRVGYASVPLHYVLIHFFSLSLSSYSLCSLLHRICSHRCFFLSHFYKVFYSFTSFCYPMSSLFHTLPHYYYYYSMITTATTTTTINLPFLLPLHNEFPAIIPWTG